MKYEIKERGVSEMKSLIKILFVIPLLCLGGCYTQMAYRDAYDYQNQNNDTTAQPNNAPNSEFLSPVCNVVEEPIVDLSDVGVTYNPYNPGNGQTRSRTEQKTGGTSGNNSNISSTTNTRNRVNSTQSNPTTNPDNGRTRNTNTSTTSQPTRTRDNGQSSSPSREKSRN